MPTNTVITTLNKNDMRKVSQAIAKQLLVKITLTVVVTVAASLISTAILAKISPEDEVAAE